MDRLKFTQVFNDLCSKYDVDSFHMQPELIDGSDVDELIIGEAYDPNIPYYIRSSAPGYLDCTDWDPINDVDDLKQWMETQYEDI